MPLNFPTGPTSGATYTYGGKTWQWNGYAWDSVSPSFVNTLNGCTGNLTITGTANQVTVTNSCPNIVVGLPNNLTVGNLTVTGNLIVSGGMTAQFSEVVLIEDNIIVLNANVTGGSPTENAGIQISRGASAAVQVLWNETTDKWTFTNDGTNYYDLPTSVVTSVNGSTGAVTGLATTGSNTFTGLNTFNAGISATGGTFSGDIAVNGGDITTTATSATLFNSNATTIAIGAAANSVTVASSNQSGMTFGLGYFHKLKTNRVITGSTAQAEIFRFEYIHPTDSTSAGRDGAYAEVIITAEKVSASDSTRCGGSQITKMVIAANPQDNTVFHAEYGNISTNGNLATYSASADQSNVLIYATPGATATTRFKVLATLIGGEYGGIIVGGA